MLQHSALATRNTISHIIGRNC